MICDPRADETWLPAAHARAGVENGSQVRVEVVPVHFLGLAGWLPGALASTVCHGTSMGQMLTFLDVHWHSKTLEFQGFSSMDA